MNGKPKNAIERRIDYLAGLWNQFAEDSTPRLMRWVGDPDELKMVNILFDLQEEENGELPDMFIRLEVPFQDESRYAFELIEAFVAGIDASREEIADAGLSPNWTPPSLPTNDGYKALLSVCQSFYDYYQDIMERLVLVLAPENVNDGEAFQRWLLLMVRSGLPETIRLTLLDIRQDPALDLLCQAEPTLVYSEELELEMPEAMQELAEEPMRPGPGPHFRRHFVALLAAADKGDMDLLNKKATAAVGIAQKQGWHVLEASVYMAVGTANLNQQKLEFALKHFRQAADCSAAGTEGGDPAGGRMFIQARFSEAAALLSAGQYAPAAEIYESVPPLAEAEGMPIFAVEGYRMAAYCHEVLQNQKTAWDFGLQALDAAEQLDEETRKNSTLPYVGQGLLRLLGKEAAYRPLEKDIRLRMETLVGEDWEQNLIGGEAAS